jgi:hypothetical protein
MSMVDAKNLHADITRLLLELQTLRKEKIETASEQVITVQIGGGSF